MRLQLRRLARHWARNRVVTGVFLLLLILASSVSVMFAEHIRNADEVYAEYYDVTNLGDLFATARWIHLRGSGAGTRVRFDTRHGWARDRGL